MALTKAEYLKRYLNNSESAPEKEKKRRKKQRLGTKLSGLKLVDEDLGLDLVPGGIQVREEEDTPTVAEIIDERPEKVKILEQYQNEKWKKITGNGPAFDPFSMEIRDENNSPRRQERHDSDESPRRTQNNHLNQSPHGKHKHNSDQSPPRRQRHDSDQSPPRRQKKDPDPSPTQTKRRDSNYSPPRRQRHDSDHSPPRRERRDSDQSPPRRQRHDSDQSPQRRQRHDSDQSPPRRQRHDSDQSPPRRQKHDSDQSRVRRQTYNSDQTAPKKRKNDSDLSPPRRQARDVSPKKHNLNTMSAKVENEGVDIASSLGSCNDNTLNKLSPKQKTLAGKMAGLSSAADMRKEALKLKEKEDSLFRQIGEDALGKDSKTVFRDKKTGKKRDLVAEKEGSRVAEAKNAAWKEKYDHWGKGVRQGAEALEKIADTVHEMSKPLARLKDDSDLDRYLKEQDREGDPMLQFMKNKSKKAKGPVMPQYKGPPPPPNRYNIAPGYRWDGVDRSNGFEKKFFLSVNNRKAIASQAYKWSSEDL